ncbi:MAG TPA: hypothetical protein PLF13_03675 [candidate division Zixibacteria bacterium]|nr:hypothetical protein [candidate division Zixibacteria bacterium]
MGTKLVDYYEKAKAIGGMKAQFRLAMLTLLPSQRASQAPDSPELIQKFEKAIQQIKAEA